jgi:hypothetical protein
MRIAHIDAADLVALYQGRGGGSAFFIEGFGLLVEAVHDSLKSLV